MKDNPTGGQQKGADSFDSESVCQVCGGVNPVWFAPSPLWNKVMRYSKDGETYEKHEFICPNCFIVEAERMGINPTAWVLSDEKL